jgi:hypothetical protein
MIKKTIFQFIIVHKKSIVKVILFRYVMHYSTVKVKIFQFLFIVGKYITKYEVN